MKALEPMVSKWRMSAQWKLERQGGFEETQDVEGEGPKESLLDPSTS